MAFSLTKNPDGDISLGNLRAEWVTLKPAVSDYVPGGYLIQGIAGTTETTGDIGLSKVLFVIDCGGASNYKTEWNPNTSKLQVWVMSTNAEVGVNVDLSNLGFNLLVVGL